jgi:hypothetical protein
MFNRLCLFIKHYVFTIQAVLICSTILIWIYGCQSTTPSPTDPKRSVTRDSLFAEVESFNAKVDVASKDLDIQDAVKLHVVNIGKEFIEEGKVSPGSLLLLLGNVLGIGSLIDNKRKDTIIKTLKSNGNSSKVDPA